MVRLFQVIYCGLIKSTGLLETPPFARKTEERSLFCTTNDENGA